ncbi:SRPBCC family protein [Roseomonas terrae]|jgi:carbon monoxide dehydrogenase subunit G|uniref:SRPBCC family protein n=1 Tax=Neoroseomonas terrae TaxID=424799 RepID=A0ABS5EBF4_9PROT|nr:SRPBCC family protein [Neoroseomonas terrae]MBR0648353.1 SRPBCC family protein [Neoroseomonas terrae]
MDISEKTRIDAPLAEVWPLLSDPALVASCIPGAQLAPDEGDGVWRGSIRVRFGPTAAVFRGEATLAFDHAAHRCTIEGRGIDQRGASRAMSNGTIEAAAEGDATLLTVDGSFKVTGPLETFANAGGVHVARALLAEFSENIARLIRERGTAAAPAAQPEVGVTATVDAPPAVATQPPPAAASELSALSLFWRIVKSWVRSLFQGKR